MRHTSKSVDFAYPSSTTAQRAGFPRSGCWVVSLSHIDTPEGECSKERLASYAPALYAQAVRYAETLSPPWLFGRHPDMFYPHEARLRDTSHV